MNTPDQPEDGPFDFLAFSRWMKTAAAAVGKSLAEKVLVAYYVARDPATSPWARGVLVSALAYVGMPVDALPDVTPIVGFSDDATVVALALGVVAASIRPRHHRQSRKTMRRWGLVEE